MKTGGPRADQLERDVHRTPCAAVGAQAGGAERRELALTLERRQRPPERPARRSRGPALEERVAGLRVLLQATLQALPRRQGLMRYKPGGGVLQATARLGPSAKALPRGVVRLQPARGEPAALIGAVVDPVSARSAAQVPGLE